MMDAAADYLTSVNLSGTDHEGYSLKWLPRPKGRATHVIVTEYDLARKEAMPHDVIVDTDGHAWYSDFGHQFVGELDPKTGKVTEYPSPYGERGTRDMVVDAKGRIWYGAQPYFKAGYVRVRTEAEKALAPGK
jgi:streptogramin lyase